MQEIPREKEKGKEDDEGAGEPMLEVKNEGKNRCLESTTVLLKIMYATHGKVT